MKDNINQKVTIILNVYNAQNHIETFLKSLKNQTYQHFKLLVVDDGSTDDTIDKIGQYSSSFDMTIFKRPHEGLQKARKFGVDQSKSEFIIILDADLVLDKDAVRELIEPLKDKHVGGVGGVLKNHARTIIEESFGYLKELFYQLKRKNGETDWISGGFCAFKKNVINSVGGYISTDSSEDLDMSWKIKKQGFKLVQNTNAIAYHQDPTTLKELWKREKHVGFREYFLTRDHMKESLKLRRILRFYPFLLPIIIPLLVFIWWPILILTILLTIITIMIIVKGSLKSRLVSWVVFNVMNFAYCAGFISAIFKN